MRKASNDVLRQTRISYRVGLFGSPRNLDFRDVVRVRFTLIDGNFIGTGNDKRRVHSVNAVGSVGSVLSGLSGLSVLSGIALGSRRTLGSLLPVNSVPSVLSVLSVLSRIAFVSFVAFKTGQVRVYKKLMSVLCYRYDVRNKTSNVESKTESILNLVGGRSGTCRDA